MQTYEFTEHEISVIFGCIQETTSPKNSSGYYTYVSFLYSLLE
jgi:hypothetical protein